MLMIKRSHIIGLSLTFAAASAVTIFCLWQNQRGYQHFKLIDSARENLLGKYPPKFVDVVAHHITYAYGVRRREPMPITPKSIEVIGYSSDDSLECLVVEVDGTYNRPDGGIFHITLSKEPHRAAKESNDVLARGWKKIALPIPIIATAEFSPI